MTPPRSVLVDGIPVDMTVEELWKIAERFGEVEDVRLLDPDRRRLGCGFFFL